MSGDTDDLPNIAERYSGAVRTSNLRSVERTTQSPADIVGAFALAGIPNEQLNIAGHPLGTALLRYFVGDNKSAGPVLAQLAEMAWAKAHRTDTRLRRLEAEDLARAVFAWHRDGTCLPCGGHGYKKVEGAPALSGQECPACKGTRKVPFDRQFQHEHRFIARWLSAEIEREMNAAGPAAMARLAPSLEL